MNWNRPDWRGSFYPEDLPDDWMLSYYNTQFQAVYLPAVIWQAVSDAIWAQWLGDTQDGFCFVLEPGDAGAVPPVSPRVLLATPAWTAAHVWWLDQAPDLRALAQRIAQQATTGSPLFVFSLTGDLVQLERANNLKQVMGY
jgi:hypothetical protein